jgi:DNA invertase Pin-like site-specific DNA recombinase
MDAKIISNLETRPRAVGYARLSKEGDREHHSIEAQVQAIRTYCQVRQWDLVEVYVDDGVSGAVRPDERPEMKRMIEDVLNDGISYIVVKKLDRLGRKAGELLTLLAALEEKGVALVSIDDNIDTSTASGRLLRGMLAVIAEFERDLIRERTKAGLAIARQKGKYLGGVPRGMIRDAEGRLQDAGRSELIRKLRARVFMHREPLAKAARELGIPYATAWRMLYGQTKRRR